MEIGRANRMVPLALLLWAAATSGLKNGVVKLHREVWYVLFEELNG